MICPKCGFNQPQSAECIKCGIIIEKFIALQEADTFSGPVKVWEEKEKSNGRKNAKLGSNIFKVSLLIGLILFGLSYLNKNQFPDAADILEDLYQHPVQSKTDKEPFDITVGDVTYSITPLYNYELWGMIVSLHHSGGWMDMYHHSIWKDFINIKDVCVIWGARNIRSEVYKRLKFSSDTWTCYYYWNDRETGRLFNGRCLSNNHLLSDEKKLNRLIMDAEIGDQIYFRGYLSNYSHSNNTFRRGTSTTRNDTGNGACETIYLEDFEILEKANPMWRFTYTFSKYLCLISILAFIFFLIKDPLLKK
jgi:hypothetical protein